jgi:Domain of unknown function (DUF4129)
MIDINRDAAHDAAQRELAKPIYPKASLTERITDWIHEWIYRLILKGSSLPGGWFTIAVLLIIVAVLVVIAVRIARRTMRTNRGMDYRLFGSDELTAAEHRAAAQQSAAQGDWVAAIRHRLRAIARQLEETGVVTPVPGRTATELAHDAGQSLPALASELLRAATSFNEVTYGGRPGTESAYRQIADLDERLGSRMAASGALSPPDHVADSWTQVR